MTFSFEDKSPRVEARVSPDLKTHLEDFCEEHDVTKSEVIRKSLRRYLPNKNEGGPQDPELRDTWRWLRHRANDRNEVPSVQAVNELAQHYSIHSEWVKHAKLRPLERGGWITPAHKSIIVHPIAEQPTEQQQRPNPQK